MDYQGKKIDVVDAPGFWDLMQHLARAVAEPDRNSEFHQFSVSFYSGPNGKDVWIDDLSLTKWDGTHEGVSARLRQIPGLPMPTEGAPDV